MRRQFIFPLLAALAAAATPAFGQTAASIPDLSGAWVHASGFGFEPPLSGPGPVTNRSRLPNGRSNFAQLVGDYTNPMLKPQSAEVVKKLGEISVAGIAFPNPQNQCWPQPVPYIFWNMGVQLLQRLDHITMVYAFGDEVRHVRLNEPHPPHVTPSWYGDSVGRFEGDTLVIDTIGIKADRPFAMIDVYGTPYTGALHVIERYRLIDYQATVDAQQRSLKENVPVPANDYGLVVDPDYKGKGLQQPSRTAPSPCPGPRSGPIGVPAANGRNTSVPRIGTYTGPAWIPASRMPTGRISEQRAADKGTLFEVPCRIKRVRRAHVAHVWTATAVQEIPHLSEAFGCGHVFGL
jgi:hypothetical protein